MEKKLGRYLRSDEVVHHKNNIRTDNREENLEYVETNAKHQILHGMTERPKNSPECTHCHAKNAHKHGVYRKAHGGTKQIWKCFECKKSFVRG